MIIYDCLRLFQRILWKKITKICEDKNTKKCDWSSKTILIDLNIFCKTFPKILDIKIIKKKILRRWDGNELFFCGMVDQRKSVQCYLQPWPLEEGLNIANLWYGLEPIKKLNSESVQWSCAKVITTTCSCQMKFAANCSFELLRNWSSSSRFPLVCVSKTSKIEQK